MSTLYRSVPPALDQGVDGAFVERPARAFGAFALTFALMLSDYMSRTVINAILPLLKSEWALTDAELGSLVSIVAVMVGVMSLPVSFLADRWGRVRSVAAMAAVWGLATVACGFSGNFVALLIARAAIGLGEAGYGSAGGAVLMQIFAPRMRSTVAGAASAAAIVGSVLGISLGGIVAARFGWRAAFFLAGAVGLILGVAYLIVVREPPRATGRCEAGAASPVRVSTTIEALFAKRAAVWSYVGNGFQTFAWAALAAWLPSYLNRYYALSPGEAGVKSGLLIMISGAGMVACGYLADRLGRCAAVDKMRVCVLYALLTGVLLAASFLLPPGTGQVVLLGLGMFVAVGHIGPSVAVITDVTDSSIHATVIATFVLFGNLLGQAPGPFVTGIMADGFGLGSALQIVTLSCLFAAAAFAWGSRFYQGDLDRAAASASNGLEG